MSEGGGTPGGQRPPQPPWQQGPPPSYGPQQQPRRPGAHGRPQGPTPPWQQQPPAPPRRPAPARQPALPDWGQGPGYQQPPPGPQQPPAADPWGQDEPGGQPPRWGAEEPQIGGPQWNWQPSLDYTYTPRRPRRKGLLIGLAGGGGAVLVVIVVLLVWIFTRGGGGGEQDVAYKVAWQVANVDQQPVDAFVAGNLAIRADSLGVAAYNAGGGQRRWRVGVPAGQQLCTVSPDAPGNVLAFVSGTGESNCTTVTAIDVSTGKKLWSANPPTKSGLKPRAAGVAVLQNKVVVSNGYRVLAYDTRSGKAMWNIGPANPHCGPGDVMASDKVLIALVNCSAKNVSKSDDAVYSINPADGKTVWTTHLPNEHGYTPPRVVNVSPAIVRVEDEANKPQYQVFGDQGKLTTSFSPSGGAGALDGQLDQMDVLASLHIRYPFVVADDVLVGMGKSADGGHGVVVGVDLTNGKRKWEKRLGNGYDARVVDAQGTAPATKVTVYEQKPGSTDGFQRLATVDPATGGLTEDDVVTKDVGSLDQLYYTSGRSVVVMAKNTAAKQAITAYAPK